MCNTYNTHVFWRKRIALCDVDEHHLSSNSARISTLDECKALCKSLTFYCGLIATLCVKYAFACFWTKVSWPTPRKEVLGSLTNPSFCSKLNSGVDDTLNQKPILFDSLIGLLRWSYQKKCAKRVIHSNKSKKSIAFAWEGRTSMSPRSNENTTFFQKWTMYNAFCKVFGPWLDLVSRWFLRILGPKKGV